MVKKIPPPPQLTGPEWQPFNRWLLELTSILADSGGVDPGTIDGFGTLQDQVDANTAAILALQGSVSGLSLQVAALINGLALANASITTLSTRSQVFNGAVGAGAPSGALGVDNDWFYNRTGAAGNRLFIKLAGAWVAQAI